MSRQPERIPFYIDINRVIDVLARQIYQSPLALLRENTQNAFDAVLLRKQLGHEFTPRIEVSITPKQITVEDNGIGMTRKDLETHYWRAGSSGKNTPEAKAAGVVGTFGIGAMANFGIASDLDVVTESSVTGERTSSHAQRDTLSATEDCIEIRSLDTAGYPGTLVVAKMVPEVYVDVEEAIGYLREFVQYVDLPVEVNEQLLSQNELHEAVKKPSGGWTRGKQNSSVTSELLADADLVIQKNGDVWITLENIVYLDQPISGILILRQGMHQIQAFRSGFGLATVSVNSEYHFGGVSDLAALQPTAGREALSTESMQLLQELVSAVEKFISEELAGRPESDSNTRFMSWALRHGRIELLSNLRMRTEPDDLGLSLGEIEKRTKASPMNFYRGSDSSIITDYASDENPLLIVASSNPRLKCELQYLDRYCDVQQISDAPKILNRTNASMYSLTESALVFRIAGVLQSDYFLRSDVSFGEISHQLPVWVNESAQPVDIVLRRSSTNIGLMLQLYESDYDVFGSMVKDFIRNVIFPRVADLVPSSTRQGAEAFLKTIRRPRELFEIGGSDLGNLGDIWQEYAEGKLSLAEAARRSSAVARSSLQVVDRTQARAIDDVIPNIVDNQQRLEAEEGMIVSDAYDALPAISRLEIESSAKLLTIERNEMPLKGYRAFLAITDRVREDMGDFFLQPHRTEIVWGGQKVLFIFQHHSGRFGLYYDLQTSQLVAAKSGGKTYPTCTLALKDSIFIPIPDEIQASFIPQGEEKKRFEVRCDLLYPESAQTQAAIRDEISSSLDS